MNKNETEKITPVPFTSVKVNDTFWAPKIETNRKVTIPISIEQSTITGRIKNFEVAGKLAEGGFCSTYPFDDSDVYKIIEGASYSLQTYRDPELEALLDSLIWKIGLAQEDDGYLYTYRTIMGNDSHPWIGSKRWEKTSILSHELYNLGHMYEAAVAYYEATGKRNFLDIAIKSANLVDHDFGWGKIESYPGHQEIEIGLVKLYRVTGDRRYLDLAKFFLDVRGPGGEEYSQSNMKVTEQTEAVGHAVRAAYMYTGMADVAALTGDSLYVKAISRIWKDVVTKKMYVTGGIGSRGENEGFGEAYSLPNKTAYCETCASVANVFWNQRMFLLKGNSKYYDVLEKTLYNSLLSGISISGDRFFYSNVLESDGRHERRAWFGCACCPSNICRFIPSIPGYVYASSGNSIYVNLFLSNEATIDLPANHVVITQETAYPWNGDIKMKVNPEHNARFMLKIRIPGWARGEAIPGKLYSFLNKREEAYSVAINGKVIENLKTVNGYVVIDRKWTVGDIVELKLPMDIRKVKADTKVEADHGKFAVQRGPIIYCAEWADAADGKISDLFYDPEGSFKAKFDPDKLGGTEIITTKALKKSDEAQEGSGSMDETEVTLIPYHLWNNRGKGEMEVWLKDKKAIFAEIL